EAGALAILELVARSGGDARDDQPLLDVRRLPDPFDAAVPVEPERFVVVHGDRTAVDHAPARRLGSARRVRTVVEGTAFGAQRAGAVGGVVPRAARDGR